MVAAWQDRVRRRLLLRRDGGNNLPAVPAIDTEILIGCKDDRTSADFRHANDTGVGKAHRDV